MKIVFLGDSITDAYRDKSDFHNLGRGYAFYSAQLLREKYPDAEFEFVNLGRDGYKTNTTLEGWSLISGDGLKDADIVSIMLGVNDTWHYIEQGKTMPDEEYESCYREIIRRVKEEAPNSKLLMFEHYLLPWAGRENWAPDIDRKIRIVRKIAAELADAFVPTDGLLAELLLKHEPSEIAADGIHPIELGARAIAGFYVNAVSPLVEEKLNK